MHKVNSKNVLWKQYKPLLTIIIILFSFCFLISCAVYENETTVDVEESGSNILIQATLFAFATMAALAIVFLMVRAIMFNISKRKRAARMAKLGSAPKTVSPKKPKPEHKLATAATAMAFEFSGKLDLFVVKESTRKPFPTTFKLNSNQTISLQELLEKCAMVINIPGAKYIFFSFEYGILQVVNNSERSFLVGNSELAENHAHQLVNGEAVVFPCDAGDNLVVSPRFLYQSRKRSSR